MRLAIDWAAAGQALDEHGDAVLFAVNQRPVSGTRGVYRVAMRHGVSRLRAGRRHTLGLIFHDAT